MADTSARLTTPSRVAALALTILWPGAGQAYWGSPRLAWTLALMPAACWSAAAVLFALSAPTAALIVAMCGAWGGCHALAFVHLLGAPRPEPVPFARRPSTGMLLAVLAVGFSGTVGTVYSLRRFVFEPYRIPSAGMMPGVVTGDHVIVRKTLLRDPIERGTIVAFRYPKDPRLVYLQRVVALPGDRVAFHTGKLSLPGVEVTQEFVDTTTLVDTRCEPLTVSLFAESVGGRTWTIATDGTGYLGDTREVGVPEGHVFVVGDNRDHSEDSRRWGFLPMDHIVGTADRVWFSVDPCGVPGSRSGRNGLSLRRR